MSKPRKKVGRIVASAFDSEILVTHCGLGHVFATAGRSTRGLNPMRLLALAKEIKKRFPESDGYEVTVHFSTRTAAHLTVDELEGLHSG